ncbi:hypothetical protein H5410_031667 [Solanum commersonii]|uniref:Uncharacterized protein n=1 Tax=Solanum commersonii TaxID=4109 RepID=A0A9J5YIZ2_SOLCO|nr:hypothetical protein H5410_031667 [Solanum commersonii]
MVSYQSSRQSSLLLSRGKNRNVNFPLRKRICVTTTSKNFEQRNHPSIEIILDECLFEVFKRLPNGKERSVCARVSKRWLTLLSSIHKDKIAESNGIEGEGYLVRSLVSREATDVRLAPIAVGATNYGGLAKLSIRGDNLCHVGDKGLSEIAPGCHLLKKLYLFQCPKITDNSLLDIAKNCTHLTFLTISFCSKIGNKSPKVVGQYCPNLKLVVLKKCPLIRDRGIEDLFYSNGHILIEVELHALHISDISLKTISQHRTTLTSLAIGELRRKLKTLSLVKFLGVNDSINAVPSKAHCCNSVVSLSIHSCLGIGNATIAVIGRLCHKLTQIELSGLICITDEGLFPLVKNCATNLVVVNLSACVNITDISVSDIVKLNGRSLKFLLVDSCRRITDATLVEIWNSCWMLNALDVSKCGITNSRIKTLSGAIQLHLLILSLSGCPLVSDNNLPFLLDLVQNLQGLNIHRCPNISSITVDALVKINPASDNEDMLAYIRRQKRQSEVITTNDSSSQAPRVVIKDEVDSNESREEEIEGYKSSDTNENHPIEKDDMEDYYFSD